MTLPETKTAALEPCPFCESTAVRAIEYAKFGRIACAVLCDDCEAMGPHEATATEAIPAWNRHAASGNDAAFDANVDRLKACEHIADGDDGWERLRNECPSTAAVARLRDAFVAASGNEAALKARIAELEGALRHLEGRGGLGSQTHAWLREILEKGEALWRLGASRTVTSTELHKCTPAALSGKDPSNG